MVNAVNHLAEQHIREHEARLKHLDEMLERADKGIEKTSAPTEIRDQLVKLREAREKLASDLEEIRQASEESEAEKKLEQMGPMIIWETVAEKLEKLVQRIEH